MGMWREESTAKRRVSGQGRGATAEPRHALRRFSLLGRVWHDQTYRTFLLLMILMSLGASSGLPLIALFLVRDMGVDLSTASLFFISMAAPGLFLGIVLGRRSDRWRSRLPFIVFAASWLGIGWFVIALSQAAWLTLSVGAMFLSFGGVLMGQLYAALHDVMTVQGEAQPALINTTIRTGFSFGFVFGPVAGSFLASVASLRAGFVAAGCLYFLCLVLLRSLSLPSVVHTTALQKVDRRADSPVFVFAALCALGLSGQTVRNTYLSIYVTSHLGGSLANVGFLIAVCPLIELVAMPVAGALAERIGLGRLIAGGLAIGTIEYVCIALSNSLWQLYVTQAMDACVVAVVLGLGMTYAQRLSPTRPGAASSLFFSASNLSNIVGGVVGSAAVPLLGIPHVFFLPALLAATALMMLLGLEGTTVQASSLEKGGVGETA